MKSRQLDSGKSPRFAQPATFMRLPHRTDLTDVDVAMLGVPFDSGTSYRPGARLGPREIRAQSALIRPYSYFQKISPFETLSIVDAGDVDAPPVGIEQACTASAATSWRWRRRSTARARSPHCSRRISCSRCCV